MRILAVVLGLIFPFLASAADKVEGVKPKYEEGVHYTVLPNQPKPAKTGNIEITEVFWYGCGHCYSFEPALKEWKKTLAADVTFTRSPAMWKQGGEPTDAMWIHAKLYYAASALGQLDTLHDAFFEAMHVKGQRLLSVPEITELVKSKGLNGENFVKTMDSFAVNSQVTQADSRQRTFQITGTPEVVVAGYYHINATKAGGQKEMLAVADFLINKVRAER
jgi:protein dithiol oxidoreductase (disulfide-forming)